MKKGFTWEHAKTEFLYRDGERLDPECNWFVLALEELEAKIFASCSGHPRGFYILFSAPYELALEIQAIGYFTVEIVDKDRWGMRMNEIAMEFNDNGAAVGSNREWNESDRDQHLKWAAEAWSNKLLNPPINS